MKRTKKDVGTLRYLMSFVVENWWLKLLALALAVIIYQSLKPEVSNNERIRKESYRTPQQP